VLGTISFPGRTLFHEVSSNCTSCITKNKIYTNLSAIILMTNIPFWLHNSIVVETKLLRVLKNKMEILFVSLFTDFIYLCFEKTEYGPVERNFAVIFIKGNLSKSIVK
jgi:hypothetical protein